MTSRGLTPTKLLIKKAHCCKDLEKNIVNDKPVFIFNIYSVILFEGSTSFSSFEKCMFPSSLIFSCRKQNPEAPVKQNFSSLEEPAANYSNTMTKHHLKCTLDKLTSSRPHLLTYRQYQSINFMTPINSTETRTKKHVVPFFCFRSSFWEATLMNYMFVLQQNSYALSCYTPELISLCESVATLHASPFHQAI